MPTCDSIQPVTAGKERLEAGCKPVTCCAVAALTALRNDVVQAQFAQVEVLTRP